MSEIKLILGDCREKIKEMDAESIDLIIADPPYIVTEENWDKEDIINEKLSWEFHRILKDSGSFYCWGGDWRKTSMLN